MGTVSISGTSYDIYGTQADAKKYFAARTDGASFSGRPDLAQKQLLVMATRMIDRQIWQGAKTSSSQPLAFPRTGMTVGGEEVDGSVVPDDVEFGCYELAMAIGLAPKTESQASIGQNVRSVGAGPARVEFFRPTLGGPTDFRFPTVVQELLGKYLSSSAPSISPIASGTTDQESSWSDFGIRRGI